MCGVLQLQLRQITKKIKQKTKNKNKKLLLLLLALELLHQLPVSHVGAAVV